MDSNNTQIQEPRNMGGCNVDHVYCDGISQIQVIGDMVKIDLVTLVPVSATNAAPAITGRLIMPLATFLNAEDLFKKCIGQLVANGTIEETK